MVENKLTRAIRELVAAAVKNFALPTKPERGFAEGELRAPQVVNGYLPPKRTGQKDDFPFVLVRADEGATDQDSTEVKVSIIVGTYSEEYDGHEYCLNVMARIRTALCSLPGMVGSVRISVSGEVIPGAAQRGCPLYLRCSMPDLMR